MQVCHRGRNKQTDCDRKWRVGDTDRQRLRGKNNKDTLSEGLSSS